MIAPDFRLIHWKKGEPTEIVNSSFYRCIPRCSTRTLAFVYSLIGMNVGRKDEKLAVQMQENC